MASTKSFQKDLKKFLSKLENHGVSVEFVRKANTQHNIYKIGEGLINIASTPSDSRAFTKISQNINRNCNLPFRINKDGEKMEW